MANSIWERNEATGMDWKPKSSQTNTQPFSQLDCGFDIPVTANLGHFSSFEQLV